MLGAVVVCGKVETTEPAMERLVALLERRGVTPCVQQLSQAGRFLLRTDTVLVGDVLEEQIFPAECTLGQWSFLTGKIVVISQV
jgi:hypothetical protein